jgi:hypothetical protein
MTGQPSPCDTVGMAVELKKRPHEPVVLAKMVGDAYRWIINAPGPPMSYDDAWRDLHKRVRLFWLLFLGWAAGAVLSEFVLDAIHPGLGDSVWIAIPWIVAVFAAGLYWELFPCPRCGELFFWGGLFGGFNQFRRKCQYCGLRKWQSSDDQKTPN